MEKIMKIGDIVVRKSYGRDITFKVIDVREKNGRENIILKGINIRIIADSTIDDLEPAEEEDSGTQDKILNTRVSEAINKAISIRGVFRDKAEKSPKIKNKDELVFGRPGKILHVDGDSDYMETCLKVYKQLYLDAVGKSIPESEQPGVIVDLVKEIKPDIVVLTGHDSVIKDPKDYLDLNNYRNSKYYLESVKNLRNYNSSYDELVIFAGACQSCYERILDVGANPPQLRFVHGKYIQQGVYFFLGSLFSILSLEKKGVTITSLVSLFQVILDTKPLISSLCSS
jgi:spore coat assembly protein